jgi:hypothetical protein
LATRKITALFGAGASMDANLPNAYRLTREVYSRLSDGKSQDAILYAVVVSKLIARNAKNGLSPFSDINIEDVYDGLKRLLNKDSDFLSEFVSGWDPIATLPSKPFDAQAFANDFASVFSLNSRRSLDGTARLSIDQSHLRRLVAELQRALDGDFYQYRGASLEPFLSTLSKILNVRDKNTSYMQKFLNSHSDDLECIATLNYDQLVEVSSEKNGSKVDFGLTQWNDKRFVRFHGQSLKLIKLHGSTNWYIKNHDEINISDDDIGNFFPRAMIFGGQSDKLVPYGPFLHLRHQFQQFLQGSSYLLVVGYSFRDVHLNALIRSWVATRQRGKIIIVDPGEDHSANDVFRYSYILDEQGRRKGRKVEIRQIALGFSDALPSIEKELRQAPVLT